jgi:uncharacterized protein YgiM (DUF1202 family)
MKKIIVILMGLLVGMTAGMAYSLETYYVQSRKAKVLSAPSFKASVLGEAGKGTRLSAITRVGSWMKVSYYDKEGYVAAILLSSAPPLTRSKMFKADTSELKQGVRRRASTYTSAAAARGLAADDRRRLSGDDKFDYDGLEKMEQYTVPEADLVRFMEGGNL